MSSSEKRKRFRKILKIAATNVSHGRELLREFLADYPDHPGALLQLARTFVEMARFAEARRIFRHLIPRAPAEQLPWVYSHLGHLYRQKGDHRRAAEWYRKAIEHGSGGGDFHVFLGAVLAASGKLEEALSEHRRALRSDSVCREEALLNIGYVLRAQEEYAEARLCFKKALQLDPTYREAKAALADVESALRVRKRPPATD